MTSTKRLEWLKLMMVGTGILSLASILINALAANLAAVAASGGFLTLTFFGWFCLDMLIDLTEERDALLEQREEVIERLDRMLGRTNGTEE
jgi:hypothetical protein